MSVYSTSPFIRPEARRHSDVGRSPIPWYGSKTRLAPDLLRLMPNHKCYVEVFGGSASLLFAKPQSHVEVFNDLDRNVVHFFETLRGQDGDELIKQIRLTPHSRFEHALCKHRPDVESDPVERARQFYVCVCQSYSGIYKDTYSCSKRNPVARTWVNRQARLETAVKRLRSVLIEELDFRRLIPKYDSPETLFYCDPPYVPSTRTSHGQGSGVRKYRHEMTDRCHEELLHMLLRVQGKVILSGYPSPLYERQLDAWQRQSKQMQCPSATAKTTSGVRREEVVWMNF